jgi:nicotinamide riboside transporter PnuC
MSVVLLGYISFVFSAIGIVLNARKNILCWPVWLFSNVGWIIYSLMTNSIPLLILWIFYSIFNIYGWKKWYNDLKSKEKDIRQWPDYDEYS